MSCPRIAGKRLLMVASGPLAEVPMSVLVTEKPATALSSDLAVLGKTAWLGVRTEVALLPAVSSLLALRSKTLQSKPAPKPFIGFGNPVLQGDGNCGSAAVPDKCPAEENAAGTVSSVDRSLGRVKLTLRSSPAYFRNGLANPQVLKRLCPLPDTAFELKCVARSLKASKDSVIEGQAATVTAVKHAALDSYRVVHFATHGLLPEETAMVAKDLSEPALVLRG